MWAPTGKASDVPRKPACSGSRRTLRYVHRRLRQDRREAVSERLLQWEDFGPGNARRILEKYRGQFRIFNDDLQGTGAITLAAAVSAMRVCGTLLRNQRVVIFGTGTAGIGVADLIRDVMISGGEGMEARGDCERHRTG
jgi:hypothetical protein